MQSEIAAQTHPLQLNSNDRDRSRHPLRTGTTVLCLLLLALTGEAAASPDNFLILLLDDLGVDKIGAYRNGECVNGECPTPPATPTIDGIAQQGVLFRNAWSNPKCSPTRVTMLTGRHAFRHRVGSVIGDPGLEMGLDPATPNVANVLKGAGYDTAAFGKWHVAGCVMVQGECTGVARDFPSHPIESGFDYFAGHPENFGDGGSDYCNWPKTVSQRTGPGPIDYVTQTTTSTTYATTETVNDAIAHIATMSEPWLAWVAFHAPHRPLHVVPTDPVGCTMTVDIGAGSVAMHDAMTTALDAEIGRLLSTLAATSSAFDRTTVFILGDNGSIFDVTRPPFDPGHAKGTVYEGGVNVPFVVSGPLVVPSAQGAESAGLVQVTDIFATLMDIVGLDPCPAGAGCAEDSLSMLPYLTAPAQTSLRGVAFTDALWPNALGYPFVNLQGVRNDRYKLVREAKPSGAWFELYDLVDDPFEQIDLMQGTLDPPQTSPA